MKFISTSEGKKGLFLFLFLLFTVTVVKSAVITSVSTGFWNSNSTWDCNCVPGNGADVVIAAGTTVTLNGISTLYRTKNLIIEANATFSNGFNNIIKVKGDYILNGTHSGTGQIELEGMFALVDGTGVITNPTDILINRNVTIPASANITKTSGSIIINGNKIITNYGVVTISTGSLEGVSTGSSWINDIGSTLNVAQNILSMGVLTADAVGNTVHYTGSANQNITLPQTSYYDLAISGAGTKFQPANLIVSNSFILAGGVFSLNTFDLNIAGNWINTGGTHDATNGTVFFNGAGNQTISHPGQEQFNKVIISGGGVKTLGCNILVNDSLIILSTLDVSPGNYDIDIKGSWNNSGIFNPQNGTVLFSGATAISGTSINSFYNVSITGSLTAPLANMNVGGNWTDSGVFIHNSSTVTFNGVSTISGFSAGSFNNLTITGSLTSHSNNTNINGTLLNDGTFIHNGGTVTFNGISAINGAALTSFNKLAISGTLTAHAVNMEVFSDFMNNGTFIHNNGTVTTNGTGTQNIGGTITPVFFNLSKVASGTVILAVNVAVDNLLTVLDGIFDASTYTLYGTGSLTKTAGELKFSKLGTVLPELTGAYSITGGSITFYGGGSQTIKSGAYHNVNIFGSGAKSLGGNIAINNNLTISSTLDATINNYSIDLSGNWINSGIFTPQNGTVTLNGLLAQSITNSAGETFYNLIIGGADIKSLGGNITLNNDLTINSTLDVTASAYSIDLKRNWINNGTFNAQQGVVTLNGTVAQTIGGTALTTFRNLTLNNVAGASLTSAENITSTLTLTSGTFSTAGQNFTLVSNAAGTARIAAIPAGADIAGDIIMQRYLASGPTSWRFLSSAVSGRTLNDWKDNFIMSGFSGSQYPTFPFISMYGYDETVPGLKDDGYIAATDISNAVGVGKGYWAYIGPVPLTIDVKGPTNKGPQTFPLTYTPSAGSLEDGWCMVGNPYPSTIDWDAAGWTKTNVSNATYIWNNANQQYAVYQGGLGINGGSRYIGSSQGFWVQTIGGSPSISLTESVKAANDIVFKSGNPAPHDALKLSLSGNGFSDETILQFNQYASSTYDPAIDAHKLFSFNAQVPSISTVTDSADYSINSLPFLTSGISVPVRTKVGVSGTYTIAGDISKLGTTLSCLLLEDLLTGIVTDLRVTSTYTFTISDTTNIPRFLIHFSDPLQKQVTNVTCNNANNGTIAVTGQGGVFNFIWKDSLGTVIQTANNMVADTLSNLTPGMYILTVSGVGCGAITDTVFIDEALPINTLNNYSNESCNNSADGSIDLSVSGGSAPYTFQWSNGESTEDIFNLSNGAYSVNIWDINGCFSSENIIISKTAEVISNFSLSSDTIFLSNGGNVLFYNSSLGAQSYEWDFGDGSAVDTSFNASHAYISSGIYTATLEAKDGNCSEIFSKQVVVNDSEILSYAELLPGQIVQIYSFDNTINVIFDFDTQRRVHISLLNLLGQQVLEDVNLEALNNSVEIDINVLSEGIYVVRVISEDKQLTKKIIR